MEPERKDPPSSPPGPSKPEERKVLRSEELFGAAREISIRHNGQDYRLQVTRNGKLILIK
jgi:hemin uptake protein HemP